MVELFFDHTHTHSMNNLRWQPHWLPRLTSLPRKSRDWRRTRETAEKKIIFHFIKSQTNDSFVNHFDGHFAYLKTLDFSFKSCYSTRSFRIQVLLGQRLSALVGSLICIYLCCRYACSARRDILSEVKGRPYWAIRRSWFARVNALCNLSL